MSDLATDHAPAAGSAAFAAPQTPVRAAAPRQLGLAGRLLIVTMSGVLFALALFYLTRLAASRENYLRDRLVAAETAVMVFALDPQSPPTPELTHKLLDAIGAKRVVVTTQGRTTTLVGAPEPGPPDYAYDAADPTLWDGVRGAFETLTAPRHSMLRVEGVGRRSDARIELTIDQKPLIRQLWRLSRIYLMLSLVLTAALSFALWAALWRLVIRPVQRLTTSIIAFGADPQDAGRIIAPSGRDDEIGRAEAALAAMQATLAHELSQSKRLAELGMAVARVNHDLRNMLSTAQLISDRLATIADPLAQRLAPQLVATLDRAIAFCQSALAYGAAHEPAPTRRRFDLSALVEEIVETEAATGALGIAYAVEIPPKFELLADPEHIRRAIENLGRNAAQALRSEGARLDRPPAIRFAARRSGANEALIEISDSGPGIPAEHRAHLFEPFRRTTRVGGSGLGLAIAHDLVVRNGGSIRLAPADAQDFYCGARFLITLPTPDDAPAPG